MRKSSENESSMGTSMQHMVPMMIFPVQKDQKEKKREMKPNLKFKKKGARVVAVLAIE